MAKDDAKTIGRFMARLLVGSWRAAKKTGGGRGQALHSIRARTVGPQPPMLRRLLAKKIDFPEDFKPLCPKCKSPMKVKWSKYGPDARNEVIWAEVVEEVTCRPCLVRFCYHPHFCVSCGEKPWTVGAPICIKCKHTWLSRGGEEYSFVGELERNLSRDQLLELQKPS